MIAIMLAAAAICYTIPIRPKDSDPVSALPDTRNDAHVLEVLGSDWPTLVEFLNFEWKVCAASYPVIEQLREANARQINYALRRLSSHCLLKFAGSALAVEAAAQQQKVKVCTS